MTQSNNRGDLAPETHNSEQDDHLAQAQEVAQDAQDPASDMTSPLESRKSEGGEIDGDTTQDVIDHMRDMEGSGRIDMAAYRGEDNHDDNEDTYGSDAKLDDLPSDGS